MAEETTQPSISEAPVVTEVAQEVIPETTPEAEVDTKALLPTGDYRTDPTFYAVADYFNVPTEDFPIAKDYLSEIVDFVIKDIKSDDATEVLTKIREIEDKVQPPQWGEKRYWNIRKYVRLASRKSDIEKAMGAFSRKV